MVEFYNWETLFSRMVLRICSWFNQSSFSKKEENIRLNNKQKNSSHFLDFLDSTEVNSFRILHRFQHRSTVFTFYLILNLQKLKDAAAFWISLLLVLFELIIWKGLHFCFFIFKLSWLSLKIFYTKWKRKLSLHRIHSLTWLTCLSVFLKCQLSTNVK